MNNNVTKRKTPEAVPVRSDSEDSLLATPLENPNPSPAMTVEELVRYSISQNERNFKKLDKDMAKLQREGAETRKMAARAVTSAEDTRQRVDKIEHRLAQLEAKTSHPPPRSRSVPISTASQEKSEWQELGGEEGDTVVMGGFRKHSTPEDRRTELDEVIAGLPQDLADRILTRIVPATHTDIVLLKLQISDKGPDQTRRDTLAWCTKIKEAKITKANR